MGVLGVTETLLRHASNLQLSCVCMLLKCTQLLVQRACVDNSVMLMIMRIVTHYELLDLQALQWCAIVNMHHQHAPPLWSGASLCVVLQSA